MGDKVDLQVEGLVELWRPVACLLFGLELPLLIRKMRTCIFRRSTYICNILFFLQTYQVDFHVGLEGLRLLHLQVVGSDH